MTISDLRIKDVRVLSDGWTTLKTTTFEYRARQWRMADAAPGNL